MRLVRVWAYLERRGVLRRDLLAVRLVVSVLVVLATGGNIDSSVVGKIAEMNDDYIYWTFSAAAQSISAFVAFLLTGYALVHTLMEAAREKDDSLAEIHATLQVSYHRRLTFLAWLTGSAIILSIVVVYLNRSNTIAPTYLVWLASSVDLFAVVSGLAFVVSIVNPKKYERAAYYERS